MGQPKIPQFTQAQFKRSGGSSIWPTISPTSSGTINGFDEFRSDAAHMIRSGRKSTLFPCTAVATDLKTGGWERQVTCRRTTMASRTYHGLEDCSWSIQQQRPLMAHSDIYGIRYEMVQKIRHSVAHRWGLYRILASTTASGSPHWLWHAQQYDAWVLAWCGPLNVGRTTVANGAFVFQNMPISHSL